MDSFGNKLLPVWTELIIIEGGILLDLSIERRDVDRMLLVLFVFAVECVQYPYIAIFRMVISYGG